VSTPPSPPEHPGAEYPGAELGLPPQGAGSLATFLRRAIGAVIDWMLAQLIVIGVFGIQVDQGGAAAFAPLGVFALMHLLLVGTTGMTIGHRVVGIGVASLDHAPLRPGQTAIRTLLVVLFLPALFTGSDGRGWHDRAAGTLTIRTR
jgi:uncharacterized RDD family membrane protein YckC